MMMTDAQLARAYWATRPSKVFAVDAWAGPAKRPTFEATMYVRAATREGAIQSAKRNCVHAVKGLRFHARLAGPRELGATNEIANGMEREGGLG